MTDNDPLHGIPAAHPSTLAAAGLSPEDEHVYRQLVSAGEADLERLATLTRRPVGDTGRVVERLRAKGLVAQLMGDPPRFTPTPPDVAFSPLLLNGQAALAAAQNAVADLTEEYRANVLRRDAARLVEVVHGAAGIRQAIRNLQLSATEEVMWFCRAGYVAMPSSDNDEEFAALGRGVRYRVIYEEALLEEPGMLDSVALGVRAGEEARAFPTLPVRLAIADRSIGLCPLVAGGEDSEPTAALVRDSNLLTALIALFESYWSAASPLRVTGESQRLRVTSPASPIPEQERELLSLLVAGVTDKAIATRLGVSTRTVQRRVAELQALANADTRMQLAWQAARRGWLD